MRKIILNKCFGGFGLSKEGYELYAKKKGLKLISYNSKVENGKFIYRKTDKEDIFNHYFTKDLGDNVEISDEDYEKYHLYLREKAREDKTLIEVVEELGEKASGMCGKLKVVEIPDNAHYVIDEYDGIEIIYYSESEIKEK